MANNHLLSIQSKKTSQGKEEGWSRTEKFKLDDIQSIVDPNVETTEDRVTPSIPSPFAQMHLMDTAFGLIPSNEHRGKTIYHRLVSQCLDLLEIIFHSESFKTTGLKIIRWNKDEQIAELKAEENVGQQLLANAMEIYMGENKPLGATETLFLFSYDNYIIGGTSPLTLVFVAPEVHKKPITLKSTQGTTYFEDVLALHERDEEFQEYVHKLFLAFQDSLRVQCKRMYNYTKDSRIVERKKFDDQIKNLAGTTGKEYTEEDLYREYIEVKFDNNSPVYVPGGKLYAQKPETIDPSISDFRIKPDESIKLPEKLPLVLLEGYREPNMKYLLGNWSEKIEVPWIDENTVALKDRHLPGYEHLEYPWLGIHDFLEDTLITLPFELNRAKFHSAVIEYERETENELDYKCPFLLPLKKRYFEYFSPESIAEHLTIKVLDVDKKKAVSGCYVKLTIPIQKGKKITFSKYYYANPMKDGQGKIFQSYTNLAFFPFYKVKDKPEYNDFYKVLLIDADVQEASQKEYDLDFYYIDEAKKVDQSRLIKINRKPNEQKRIRENDPAPYGDLPKLFKYKRRERTKNDFGTTYYQINNTSYDLIELHHAKGEYRQKPIKGLIIPNWKDNSYSNGSLEYSFAVDFGTTNTHIAYTKGGQNPVDFEISDEKQLLITLLNAPSNNYDDSISVKYNGGFGEEFLGINDFLHGEFIPSILDAKTGYKFPIRTAIATSQYFKSETRQTLSNINIAFNVYDQLPPQHIKTNLKWDTKEHNPKYIDELDAFFEQLLLMIRAMVIQNDGNLTKTQLIWFVPLSIGRRLGSFAKLWEENYQEIFKASNQHSIGLSESIAPYYYLQNEGTVTPDFELLNIDIGGGTSDLLFLVDEQNKLVPRYNASFKFAGNDLWGEGYTADAMKQDNGFLKAVEPLLEERALGDQDGSYELFVKAKDNRLGSADLIGLLFKYPGLRFEDDLRMSLTHLKIVMFLHYTAIVYHTAQVIKYLDLSIPRYYVFTGKGSLYIKLLNGSDDLEIIKEITKVILEKVCNKRVPANFQLVMLENPKEATARGGSLYDDGKFTGAIYRSGKKVSNDIQTIQLLGINPENEQKMNRFNHDHQEQPRELSERQETLRKEIAEIKASIAEKPAGAVKEALKKHLETLKAELHDIEENTRLESDAVKAVKEEAQEYTRKADLLAEEIVELKEEIKKTDQAAITKALATQVETKEKEEKEEREKAKEKLVEAQNLQQKEVVQSDKATIKTNLTYQEIDDELQGQVIANVKDFLDLVLNNQKIIELRKDLGIEAEDVKFTKDEIYKDLADGLRSGLHMARTENDSDSSLAETLFFYPLKQKLYELSKSIYEKFYKK